MTILTITPNNEFLIHVSLTESDKYSQLAELQFVRRAIPDNTVTNTNLFLTLAQMESLGAYILGQAAIVRAQQDSRHSESSL